MADLYMRDIRAWRDSTLMLSFEEKGYYDELLNLIYLYDDCLPDDDDLICRAMPVNKKVHLRLRDRLIKAKLIEIKAGYYFNKRAAQEIDKINSISSKNKIKAHKRWAKSSKNNENPITAADAANHSGDDAEDMLNLMSEGENILKKNKSKKNDIKK